MESSLRNYDCWQNVQHTWTWKSKILRDWPNAPPSRPALTGRAHCHVRTDESTEPAISQKPLLPCILKRVWLTLTGDWNSPDRQPMVYFVILVCDLPLPLAKCYGVMDGHHDSTARLAPILVVNGHDKTSLVIQNLRLTEDSDVRITSKACHTRWKMQLQILVLLWNGQESSEILLVPFFLLDEKDIEYYWQLHLKACA